MIAVIVAVAVLSLNIHLATVGRQFGWFASKSSGVLSAYTNVDGFLSFVDIKLRWDSLSLRPF